MCSRRGEGDVMTTANVMSSVVDAQRDDTMEIGDGTSEEEDEDKKSST